MDVRDITAEVLSANPGQHTAVEIVDIIRRTMGNRYQSLVSQYGSDAKIEDVVYSQAVRTFQAPATTLNRKRLRSDYVRGQITGKQKARFWVGGATPGASPAARDTTQPATPAPPPSIPPDVASGFASAAHVEGAVVQVPAADLDAPPAERVITTVSRVVRDTELAAWVKRQHDFRCQLCGETIRLADGSGYAEGHHLRPLGKPHDGPDVAENIVCVCPNHHAACDFGAIRLDPHSLRVAPNHRVGERFVAYHNEIVFRG